MISENYFLITALPALGDLGSALPITPAELLDHVGPDRPAGQAIEVLFLADDLLQRQALLAGEIEQTQPTVLRLAQLRDEQPLPPYLTMEQTEQAPSHPAPIDAIWEVYFRHAAATARRRHNRLLSAWVPWEVTLRNALAVRRATALNLPVESYCVAQDLQNTDLDFEVLLNEWAAARDPLAGQKILDRARWAWIAEQEMYFSFADEELTAYAARVMLLQRWERITAASQDQNANRERQNT